MCGENNTFEDFESIQPAIQAEVSQMMQDQSIKMPFGVGPQSELNWFQKLIRRFTG